MTHEFDAAAHLPPQAQVWVFGFSRPLTPEDQSRVREAVERFLPQWQSHGAPVESAYQIVEDRFVLLAAHCPTGVSGCSIDSSFQLFKNLQAEGLDGLNRGLIFYRNRQGRIEGVSLQDFQSKVDSGEIEAQTSVFDTTLNSLEPFRQGAFEVPFEKSWHARSFPLPAQPA